jgi:Endonuclease/Exonuclease/phosphatase family
LSTSFKRTRARGRAVAIAAVIGIGAIVFPAAADAGKPKKPAKVDVMTRNLYLGADLGPAIAAPTPGQAYTAVGDIYENMVDMNFNTRAKLLANEIEADKPELIGLQEVSMWRRDDVPDATPLDSTEVVYDYLELLLDELDRRGLNYTPAVIQQEADLEFPADVRGPTPNSAPDGVPDFEGRLTMRDVILVKDGVKVKETGSGNYSSNVFVNTGAFGTVTVLRGYTWADVKVKKRTKPFRFVNTHLESFNAYFRLAQATELVGGSGVTNVNKPIVLLGDLNSDPDDDSIDPAGIPTANSAAYDRIVGDEYAEDGGFADYGVEVDTCCFGEDLRDDPPAEFNSRIDHVLGKGAVVELESKRIGDDPNNRSGTGLWPTDHAGVVAKLKVG